jgi:hypothetical protein
MRVLVGLAAQPLVAAVAAFVLFPALEYTRRALEYSRAPGLHQARFSSDGAVPVAFGAAFAAVFVVVFGALPAIGWISRRGPLTLSASLAAGALLGNLPSACLLLLGAANGGVGWTVWPPPLTALIRPIAFGTLVGLACGAAFWQIAGATGPTRDTTASSSA